MQFLIAQSTGNSNKIEDNFHFHKQKVCFYSFNAQSDEDKGV